MFLGVPGADHLRLHLHPLRLCERSNRAGRVGNVLLAGVDDDGQAVGLRRVGQRARLVTHGHQGAFHGCDGPLHKASQERIDT